LNNAIDYQSIDADLIVHKKWEHCLQLFRCQSKNELYIRIALSEVLIASVLNQLKIKKGVHIIQRILIDESKAASFAPCCYPIPDDKIFAVLTNSKGLVVHQSSCTNLMHTKRKNVQWFEADWKMNKQAEFLTLIEVSIDNQRGALASIANVIAKENANIEHLEAQEKDNFIRSLKLLIMVNHQQHLNKIIKKLNKLKLVQGVKRV
jgi:(p)ppGpp synthase/HD superfamily hydrolase